MTRRERPLRWTPDEDEVLLKNIESSPHNISAACRKTEAEIGRGADACRARFCYLRSKNPSNPLFFTVGRRKAVPNRKVVRRGCPVQPKPVRVSLWKQILEFFGF